MFDAVTECTIKRGITPKALAGRLTAVTIAVILASFAIILPMYYKEAFFLMIIPVVFAIVIPLIVFKRTRVEFEYSYFEKTLTISKIVNKSSRKKIAEFDLSKSEVIAPVLSERIRNGGTIQILDYTSHKNENVEKIYSIMGNVEDAGTVEVRIEPSEELLQRFAGDFVRKFYKE